LPALIEQILCIPEGTLPKWRQNGLDEDYRRTIRLDAEQEGCFGQGRVLKAVRRVGIVSIASGDRFTLACKSHPKALVYAVEITQPLACGTIARRILTDIHDKFR